MKPHRDISQEHPLTYMPQLDGLRAVAIFIVLFNRWMPGSFQDWVPLGETGVFLFFIISGFLITRILLSLRGRSLGRALSGFYMRRAIRIFPAYYLIVMLFTLAGLEIMRSSLGWNLTYTTNFLVFTTGEWPGWASHFWSLAVEEQFYLIWPFLILLLPLRFLPMAMLSVFLLAPVTRGILVLNGFNSASVLTLPLCALDFLAGGALLAYFWDHPLRSKARKVLVPLGALSFGGYVILCCVGPLGDDTLRFALQASLVPFWGIMLVSACARGAGGITGRVLSSTPLVYLGKISYGIYLIYGFVTLIRWHIYQQLGLQWLDHAWINLAVNILINIGLAVGMYELFESPILRLRKRFGYKRSAAHMPTPSVSGGLLTPNATGAAESTRA